MCVRIELVTLVFSCGGSFISDEGATFTTPQRRLAGVAEPSEPASGLVADVQLVAVLGSSLELPRRRHRYHKQTAKMGNTRNARHVDGDDHTGQASATIEG